MLNCSRTRRSKLWMFDMSWDFQFLSVFALNPRMVHSRPTNYFVTSYSEIDCYFWMDHTLSYHICRKLYWLILDELFSLKKASRFRIYSNTAVEYSRMIFFWNSPKMTVKTGSQHWVLCSKQSWCVLIANVGCDSNFGKQLSLENCKTNWPSYWVILKDHVKFRKLPTRKYFV